MKIEYDAAHDLLNIEFLANVPIDDSVEDGVVIDYAKDVRLFAVERIRSITLTDHPYQIPLDFKVDEYVQDALGIMRSGRRIEVELLFSKKAAAWVKDKTWHPSQQTKLIKNGGLKMTLKVADNEELVGWILSFGSEVQVAQPDALRQKVKEEAQKILRP